MHVGIANLCAILLFAANAAARAVYSVEDQMYTATVKIDIDSVASVQEDATSDEPILEPASWSFERIGTGWCDCPNEYADTQDCAYRKSYALPRRNKLATIERSVCEASCADNDKCVAYAWRDGVGDNECYFYANMDRPTATTCPAGEDCYECYVEDKNLLEEYEDALTD
ncbi:hypothetical protein CYMTET_52301 [Cymbomonas tetramitiformis]|uniref:Apple domain-containing protein n=1 Tax=Cymbomonas tetramitiformis TaxID=36881 RepID=A0AAE0BJ91_9CHLO|nr:hypothetical protein CYMTET_52301 [Cymbomonas tetramitiformis]